MIRKALKNVEAIKDLINEKIMRIQLVVFSTYFLSYLLKHSFTWAGLYMKETTEHKQNYPLRCKLALSEFVFNCWEKSMLICILAIILYITTKYTRTAGVRQSKSFLDRCNSICDARESVDCRSNNAIDDEKKNRK
jgi:hypothetical protein